MKEEKINSDFMEKNLKEMRKDIETSQKWMNEALKLAYDYYKYFATLITGSLFIIVILHERVFRHPEKVGIVIISIALLVLSLILILLELDNIKNYFKEIALGYSGISSRDITKKTEWMDKKDKILRRAAPVVFILGLIALAIYVSFNLVD